VSASLAVLTHNSPYYAAKSSSKASTTGSFTNTPASAIASRDVRPHRLAHVAASMNGMRQLELERGGGEDAIRARLIRGPSAPQ
jgi:hypothetical protein